MLLERRCAQCAALVLSFRAGAGDQETQQTQIELITKYEPFSLASSARHHPSPLLLIVNFNCIEQGREQDTASHTLARALRVVHNPRLFLNSQ